MKKRVDCKEEVQKQLDVKFFLTRLNYVERDIESIIEKKKLAASDCY